MIKKTINFLSVLLIALLISAVSCEDSHIIQGEAVQRTSYLYLNYCYPVDSVPLLSLDESKTSSCININFDKSFKGVIDGSNAKIFIDNLRISDQFGNFQIDDINVEEYKNNVWELQSQFENPVEWEGIQDLDVVLVLDASGSMSPRISEIKSSAVSFVNKISSKVPDAKFAVVVFNDTVNSCSLGTSFSAISFINNVETGTYTWLNSGLNKAVDILLEGDADSKVMVTLAAGDCSDGDPLASKLDEIIERIDTTSRIQSYAIGYDNDGSLSSSMKEKIESFCVRGFALFPDFKDKKNKMRDFFDYFSQSVSTGYNITYTREKVNISADNPRQIRLKFITRQQQ